MASAIARGNKALIARQHADDGSWGGDDVKVQSSHKSDYPVAISSLAYLALMSTAPEGKEALSARKRSLEFILDTIEDGNMKNTRDNTPKVHERNVWSQGFSLFALSRLLEKKEMDRVTTEKIRSRLSAWSPAGLRWARTAEARRGSRGAEGEMQPREIPHPPIAQIKLGVP